MSVSATSSSSTAVVTAAASTTTSTSKLVKLGNGEYTAASVSADPTDATKLGLQKEKDGNYGTATPVQSTSPASSNSASSTLAAVINLQLGGS